LIKRKQQWPRKRQSDLKLKKASTAWLGPFSFVCSGIAV
jgi:hypothetical protein